MYFLMWIYFQGKNDDIKLSIFFGRSKAYSFPFKYATNFQNLRETSDLLFQKSNLPKVFKGNDRLFKVVELSMQCCGKLL